MSWQLSTTEARVLGCLIEKQITTPDYYPLTLNALTTACNQKQNRHPVMDLAETDVVRALDQLKDAGLSVTTIQVGSRMPKYRHIAPEKLSLSPAETAVLCELLIRGPQTVGELKGHSARMHAFADLDSVQQRLDRLTAGELVVELPKAPGRKECRYAHLLCGEPEITEEAALAPRPEAATVQVRADNERIAALEAEMAELKEAFAAFKKQFE